MGMSDYKKAKAIIEENEEDAEFVGPCNELLLAKAERALQVRFPPTYRRFLSEYGAGDIGDEQFFGIIAEDFEKSSIPNAIWCTLRLRRKINLPADLVVIGDTGEGKFYCLETRPDGSEGRVVAIAPGSPTAREKVAADFGEFFLERIEEVDED